MHSEQQNYTRAHVKRDEKLAGLRQAALEVKKGWVKTEVAHRIMLLVAWFGQKMLAFKSRSETPKNKHW